MQLTNICRDVLEDAQNDRYYLPQEDLARYGLQKGQLKHKGDTPKALKELVKSYLDLADVYYASAKKGYVYIPFRPRLAIHIAAELYREIGLSLKGDGLEALQGRVHVPTWKKFIITFKALSIIFSPIFWRKGSFHQRELHEELRGLPGVNAI